MSITEKFEIDQSAIPITKNYWIFYTKNLYNLIYQFTDLQMYQYVNIFISFLVGILFGRFVKNPWMMLLSIFVYEIIITYFFNFDRISKNWFIYRMNLTFGYIFGYIVCRVLDNRSPFLVDS